jgi:predicted PilT family ATPase
MLVSRDPLIIGHIIGKNGSEITRMERENYVSIEIESERFEKPDIQVRIKGRLVSVTTSQQLVSHSVYERLLSQGIQAELIKIVISDHFVSHVIGKKGVNIRRIENESGSRIQIDTAVHKMGRTVTIRGIEKSRTYALYLMMRLVVMASNESRIISMAAGHSSKE